jgi:hypothetical protein
MRNISFAITVDQFLNGTKDITRRLGWSTLEPGTVLMACRKCRGLKPGEIAQQRLGPIRILSVRAEPLDAITQDDVKREGYPDLSPADFVSMFCRHMKCTPSTIVNRIEFERIAEGKDRVPQAKVRPQS